MAAESGGNCEQILAEAYEVMSSINKLVEKAHDTHSSIYKAFGDLAGVSTIRKDKSVTEAAHTDISYTLKTMRGMIDTITNLQAPLVRLERKPRQKLVSPKIQALLKEYSPYVRLMTESANVGETGDLIETSVKELDMSAMRLQIGEFGESLTEEALGRQIVNLRAKYPKLEIDKCTVSNRTCLLIVRIPTIIQMLINFKQVVEETREYEIKAIHVFSTDEVGPYSRFQVFNRIAYDSNIIWFSIAGFSVEHRLSKLIQWFSLFDNLFSATCGICNMHLQMDPRTSQYLPPLWRTLDINAGEPNRAFHYGCLESA